MRDIYGKSPVSIFHLCCPFYNIHSSQAYSLKIDLFFNYEGGGVLYYNYEDVIKHKSKNSNGISIFNPKTESYLTVLNLQMTKKRIIGG